MAGHHLIEAYLATLGRQLPADAVEELADGLDETYQRHRSTGLPPDAAADATVRDFGEPGTVLRAYVRQAPGRRTALMLLAWGPIVGLCWGATLVAGHAWTWPIPTTARVVFGATLLVVIVTLALAATSHHSYHRTRLTIGAATVLIGLDGAMLCALPVVAASFVWPMALAVPVSLTRMTLTARALPRMLTH
ncbi:MAG TPA: hypothetical protein VKB69_10590 [Micromonosporaceae bacterium]|nr:hypothetical protein [Micromonosporaceae bacterium]